MVEYFALQYKWFGSSPDFQSNKYIKTPYNEDKFNRKATREPYGNKTSKNC